MKWIQEMDEIDLFSGHPPINRSPESNEEEEHDRSARNSNSLAVDSAGVSTSVLLLETCGLRKSPSGQYSMRDV